VLICVITLAARRYFSTSPGVLVSYFYLVLRLLQLLSTMNGSVSTVLRNWPETKIVWDWWMTSARAASASAVGAAPSVNGARPVGWELKGVRFAYPGVEKPVIENLSLRLEPGQCLVFTGPSGSGKSTLLNILLGGLKPDRGEVSVLSGGASAPLSSFRPKLYPLIGYVGPESLLVEGTLRENLVYGLTREPAAAELEAALAKAECGFVGELAGGLDYRITEQGQGLSAGQKQRLSLARAFLRGPKVLVLDEATSNLDGETEARLVETLKRVKGEMTIVAATHRSALLSIADQRVSLS
jgi:ABC-type bacteriocin/lantibiotic exporter with double-glycine peptidase domain